MPWPNTSFRKSSVPQKPGCDDTARFSFNCLVGTGDGGTGNPSPTGGDGRDGEPVPYDAESLIPVPCSRFPGPRPCQSGKMHEISCGNPCGICGKHHLRQKENCDMISMLILACYFFMERRGLNAIGTGAGAADQADQQRPGPKADPGHGRHGADLLSGLCVGISDPAPGPERQPRGPGKTF